MDAEWQLNNARRQVGVNDRAAVSYEDSKDTQKLK